jgi:hypothetical protein
MDGRERCPIIGNKACDCIIGRGEKAIWVPETTKKGSLEI